MTKPTAYHNCLAWHMVNAGTPDPRRRFWTFSRTMLIGACTMAIWLIMAGVVLSGVRR